MEAIVSHQEQKNKRRGVTTSVIVHILLILLALWPLLTFPDPPPGQEGILVNLGLPDIGEGDNNAGPAVPAEPEETQPEEVEEDIPETEESVPEEVSEPEPVEKPVEKEVVKTEDPNELALKRKKEEERKRQEEADRKKKEAEAKKIRDAEAKRKAAEEAEAKRKAEEARKKAEADALKDQIGGLFGDGEGKGNTGKPGSQGDPNGDPDASKLEGISTGRGQVGGGLGSRGVAKTHTPTDNSQKQGTVVVKVCIDKSGNVISADFTQGGSTTNDATLKRIAINSAKKWRFQPGNVDKQCGTITYNFRVK